MPGLPEIIPFRTRMGMTAIMIYSDFRGYSMTNPITLTTSVLGDSTTIPNTFFDFYLPRAAGEFLKIYLYLLRWQPIREHELSIGSIADFFHLTEGDVVRAFRYWEGEHLLAMTTDDDGRILSICLNPSGDAGFVFPQITPVKEEPFEASYDPEAGAPAGEELPLIIEQYLGHPLSRSDLAKIRYFHEDLGFSCSLIEYLIEYCVSGGHTDMRYIEAVARRWSEQGIRTVDEAKAESEIHRTSSYAILKEFGLGSRSPVPGEMQYIRKWTRSYGFPTEIICEACRRTMMNIHVPSFEYADSILLSWKEAGISSLEEIEAADKLRSSQTKAKTAPRAGRKNGPAASNSFHNFHQRDNNYSNLQQALLKKQNAAKGSKDQ